MQSAQTLIPSGQKESKKIELIFIGQSQKAPGNKRVNYDSKIFQCKEVVYSQLSIMKIVSAYPEAMIIPEGSNTDITRSDLKPHIAHVFKQIFPASKKIQELDFNHLNKNQRQVLWNNLGVQVLFFLELIPSIYQATEGNILNLKELIKKYTFSSNQLLSKFPNLWIKNLTAPSIPLEYLIFPEEQAEFSKFRELVAKDNPELYYKREKMILDFVLKAAEKTGKNRAILIMGKSHTSGIIKLVENEYKDQFYLKSSIDSTQGFLFPERQKQLKSLSNKAVTAYTSGDYLTAIDYFNKLDDFWEAVPKSTPQRQASLLSVKFNLGSAHLKLVANNKTGDNDTFSYKKAVVPLEQATMLYEKYSKKKVSKYHLRYLESLIFTSFNRKNVPALSVKLIMEYITSLDSLITSITQFTGLGALTNEDKGLATKFRDSAFYTPLVTPYFEAQTTFSRKQTITGSVTTSSASSFDPSIKNIIWLKYMFWRLDPPVFTENNLENQPINKQNFNW